MRWFRLICVLVLTSSSLPALGASDPDREWFTLKTAHFAVHSYDDGEELARRVAAYAEEAYRVVNPLLGYVPTERTHIVVVDDVDSANGFAGVIPYNGIKLLAMPPLPEDSLSDYVDWLRLLVFHEYAHVVHLNQTSGLPRLLNKVFGKNFKPNQALPRWLTEGIATWVETETSSAGRVGSSRLEMILRTQALADKIPTLSELSGVPLTPPGSTLWYVYGGTLVDEIVRGAGQDRFRSFTKTYGRRIIPYGINLAFRETTGKDLRDWYGSLSDRIKASAKRESARVRALGLVSGSRLTSGGFTKRTPRFSPDGRSIAYVRSDGHRPAALVLADAKDPSHHRDIVRCDGGCGRFSFSRDGRRILLSSGRHARRVNFYTDLVEVDVQRENDMRDARLVTQGARFTHPTLQSDGRLIWGTSTRWGKTFVEARDPRSGELRYRWQPSGYERVSHPAPTHSGEAIYVSMHKDGNHDIYRIDRPTGSVERLTFGSAIEQDLRLTRDGRWLLYSADPDGIYNIYARELATARTHRLTNVLTGAFSPDVSPDGKTLIFTYWTVDGDEIHSLPFDPRAAPLLAVPDSKTPHQGFEAAPVLLQKMDYRPIASLLPRSILPSISGDATGLDYVSLYLGSVDISERLSGALLAVYDVPRKEYSVEANLGLGTGWPDLNLTFGRYTFQDAAFVADLFEDYREEVLYGAFDLYLPSPSVTMPVSFNMGFAVEAFRSVDGFKPSHSPDENTAYVPSEGLSTRLHFGWGFGNVKRAALNISPSEGISGHFGFGLRHPTMFSHATLFNFDYRLSSYVPMPWSQDHVWAARLEGGWRGGDPGHVRPYRLGGVPQQDLLVDLINQTQSAAVWLRGYAADAFSGTSYQLLTNEYRLPIYRGRSGLDALPFFLKDIHGALFVDVGSVSSDPFRPEDLEDLRVGLGAELRLDLEVLFGVGLNFRLGYAYGFGTQGGHQFYFFLAPPP